jgi:predicted amidophosphoribosyltransferase
VAQGVIKRVRESETQTELTARERIANVSAAFLAEPPTQRDMAEQPSSQTEVQIILIDDVVTTGATISAAAAALEDVGWSSVRAVTFARALPLTVRVEI